MNYQYDGEIKSMREDAMVMNVKPQVPGITTEREKAMKPSELKEQELFYRANGR